MRVSKKELRCPPPSTRAQPSTSPTRRAGIAAASDQVLPRAALSTTRVAPATQTTPKATTKAASFRRRAMEIVYGGTEVPRGLKTAPRARSFAGGRAGFAEKRVNAPPCADSLLV